MTILINLKRFRLFKVLKKFILQNFSVAEEVITNIRNVRTGVLDACRFYAGLVQEGAPMGYLDLGGGLAGGGVEELVLHLGKEE